MSESWEYIGVPSLESTSVWILTTWQSWPTQIAILPRAINQVQTEENKESEDISY